MNNYQQWDRDRDYQWNYGSEESSPNMDDYNQNYEDTPNDVKQDYEEPSLEWKN